MASAVIFDFDGVIANTENLHYRAFQSILDPMGLGFDWERYVEELIGFDDRDALRSVFQAADRALGDDLLRELVAKKAAAFLAIIESEGVSLYDGAINLIRELEKRCPLGLCTGALLSDITPILKKGNITDAFRVVITAEDVSSCKPDPEGYLLVARKLGEGLPEMSIAPSQCVAIEDTPTGIAAAQAAGMRVVAVASTHAAALLGHADRVVQSIADIDPDELEQMS